MSCEWLLKVYTHPLKTKNRKCCFHSFETVYRQRNQCTISGNKGKPCSASLSYCFSLTLCADGICRLQLPQEEKLGSSQFSTKNKWTTVRWAAGSALVDEDLRSQTMVVY